MADMDRNTYHNLYYSLRSALLEGRSVEELQDFVRKVSNDCGIMWAPGTEVRCLQCDAPEYLDPEDIHPGVPYFCSGRCQDDYHSQMDPNNAVADLEG